MPKKEKEQVEEKKLDPRTQQYIDTLHRIFSRFNPQIEVDMDEVELTIDPISLRDFAQLAKNDTTLRFNFMRCLSVVEHDDDFQVVLHLFSISQGHALVVKASAPKDNPAFASVTPVWRGAEWYEREGAELFGVTFEGHPNPEHLLLWDGFEGYPGRKEYPFAKIQIPDDIEVPK